ncbi:MAG: hypothetical protein AAFO06_03865 [Cyanobacteria bacterium J06597_16]
MKSFDSKFVKRQTPMLLFVSIGVCFWMTCFWMTCFWMTCFWMTCFWVTGFLVENRTCVRPVV